jgi:hypothetical protein
MPRNYRVFIVLSISSGWPGKVALVGNDDDEDDDDAQLENVMLNMGGEREREERGVNFRSNDAKKLSCPQIVSLQISDTSN